MTNYIGVVEKDTDSAYGIWFPDIPGCFSAADREEDLLPNACRANERGAYLMVGSIQKIPFFPEA